MHCIDRRGRKRMFKEYLNKWIRRDVSTPWPARPLDLTKFIFFLYKAVSISVWDPRNDMMERVRIAFNNVNEEMLLNENHPFIHLL